MITQLIEELIATWKWPRRDDRSPLITQILASIIGNNNEIFVNSAPIALKPNTVEESPI